jgi:outer membrane protein W
MSSDEKEYNKGLMNGPVWNATFNYYFKDYYGLGLIYSVYSASQDKYGYLEDYGQGNLVTKDLITFIGPAFVLRYAFNKNWISNISLGVGYLGYTSKQTFPSLSGKMTGATLGLSSTVGIDYKINQHWGIGLNCATTSGLLNSMTKDVNGYKTTIKPDREEEKEGLGQMQLYLGIRYYIK